MLKNTCGYFSHANTSTALGGILLGIVKKQNENAAHLAEMRFCLAAGGTVWVQLTRLLYEFSTGSTYTGSRPTEYPAR